MRSFIAFVIAIGLTGLLGCEKNDVNSAQAPVPSSSLPYGLAGTYTVSGVDSIYIYDEHEIPLNSFLHWQPTTVSELMTFESDGTYSTKEIDASGATTYTETGILTIYGFNFTLSVKTMNGQPLGSTVQRSYQWDEQYNDGLVLQILGGAKYSYFLYMVKN
jgi:hypothetical protein